MSLTDIVPFDKESEGQGSGMGGSLRSHLKPLFLTLVIILTASLSFGLGRLSAPHKSNRVEVKFDETLGQGTQAVRKATTQTANAVQATQPVTQQGGEVVASKNGSKYHYSHCPGAKQIKEENRLSFPSASAAEASGYTLAGNCEPR